MMDFASGRWRRQVELDQAVNQSAIGCCAIGLEHWPTTRQRKASSRQPSSAVFLTGHRRPSSVSSALPVFLCATPQKSRGRAGRRGSSSDPRASTPRDIEACRSPVSCRKSAKPEAPARDVLGLLRRAPGGLTFKASRITEGDLSTAVRNMPRDPRQAGRDGCGFNRRAFTRSISSAKSFPGQRSPPRI
jgi:hypothetical protein